MGCGTRFFTEPLARALPACSVIAFDVQEAKVVATRAKVARFGLANLEVRASEEPRLPAPNGGLDGALAAFVLRKTEDLPTLAREPRRMLKPGGWLGVLEVHRHEGTHGPPLAIRLSPEQTLAALGSAGFAPQSGPTDVNEQVYFLAMKAEAHGS